MRRGDIWLARLNPNVGAEVGKVRPVLILLENALLEVGMSPVLCIPITSRLVKGTEALRVMIAPRDRLLKPCYVMIEQTRSLDRNRFGEGPLTSLTDAEMRQVERAFLGLCGLAQLVIPPD